MQQLQVLYRITQASTFSALYSNAGIPAVQNTHGKQLTFQFILIGVAFAWTGAPSGLMTRVLQGLFPIVHKSLVLGIDYQVHCKVQIRVGPNASAVKCTMPLATILNFRKSAAEMQSC